MQTEPEKAVILEDNAAEEFRNYMKKEKTLEEKEELKDAYEYYLKNCERRRNKS